MGDTSSNISSAYDAVAVTPGTTNLGTTRALYIGVSGDVTVTMASGASVTFKAAPVGILPVQVTQVTAATATNILALR